MTISNITMASLTTLIREFAPDRFEQTINQASPLLGSGVLKQEDAQGAELTPYVVPGAYSSTTWISDFGRRPVGMARAPVKGRVLPANVHVVMSTGQAASLAKLGDDSLAQLFDVNLQEVASDAARHVCRGLFGGSISPQASATWSGTAANSTVSVNFLDISLFKEGMAVDFLDDSASLAYTVRVQSVTPAAVSTSSANVAGTVVFINDVPDPSTGSVVALGATAVATADSFRLRGETAGFGGATTLTGAAINSFDSMAGSGAASNFMGITVSTTPGWVGQTLALSAAYSQEAVVGFFQRIHTRSGEVPTHIVMSPQIAAAHAASVGYHGAAFGVTAGISAARPLGVDKMADKFGMLADGYESGLRLAGKPVLVDPNLQSDRILFHNQKFAKLAVWKKLGPDEEAGDPILLNRSTFSVDVYFSGSMNLYCTKRNAIGTITGVTNL